MLSSKQLSGVIAQLSDPQYTGGLVEEVHGGDINRSFRVQHESNTLFVKTNTIRNAAILRAEQQALDRLAALKLDYYPKVLGYRSTESTAYLVLQYHDLLPLTHAGGAAAGALLATQHKVSHDAFGWWDDGFIGLSPQANSWQTNWQEFFTEQRLLPQIAMARDNGLESYLASKAESLAMQVDKYIDTRSITPSLLHGDLWSGNIAISTAQHTPILYDPAPYFGDAEADIAMTQLFGGFPPEFYNAYRQQCPQPDDCITRKSIYNLYHALNHVSMFGTPYVGLVENCMKAIT